MKKILYTFCLLAGTASWAQETLSSDILRYNDGIYGTARYRALGGAFGALGGDLSAMSTNPAGSVVFSNNFASISITDDNKANNSSYFGNTNTRRRNTLDINQAGIVFVFEDDSKDLNKFSIGLNYENTKNLNNSVAVSGNNSLNSGSQYFINQANGITLDDLDYFYYDEWDFGGQQANLGYNAFIINPIDDADPNNTMYQNNYATAGNYYQENVYRETGYNGKFTFNFGTSFKERLMLGANLNLHFSDFIKNSSFFESTNGSPLTGLQNFQFDNELHTFGNGVSLQVGAIAKATDNIRLGFSYQSPTWMNLTDELSQRVVSRTVDNIYNIDPNVINIYPEYKIRTASKVTLSGAFVHKKGLLSLDVATQDHTKSKFKPKTDAFYGQLNNQIATEMDKSVTVALGGEYIIKQFALRGGYRMEGSPYKNKDVMGDLTALSLGLGYSFGASKLDASFVNNQRTYADRLLSSGLNNMAVVDLNNNMYSLTYSFHF